MSTNPSAPRELPSSPEGLSVFEDKVYRQLVDHASSEVDLVTAYRDLAEAPETPEAARFLIRLIVDDEERHHRLFHQIALAIGNDISWRHDPDAVPVLSWQAHPELEAATERFLAVERADRRQLQALRKDMRPMRDVSLWPLLVELMERDTEKHILLLSFIKDHMVHPPR
ncbi:MAG: hypothetical protein M0Z82_18805 [Actinomycetota bacterium]|nr:hypothetical protein [Actinomycetota bacterium]